MRLLLVYAAFVPAALGAQGTKAAAPKAGPISAGGSSTARTVAPAPVPAPATIAAAKPGSTPAAAAAAAKPGTTAPATVAAKPGTATPATTVATKPGAAPAAPATVAAKPGTPATPAKGAATPVPVGKGAVVAAAGTAAAAAAAVAANKAGAAPATTAPAATAATAKGAATPAVANGAAAPASAQAATGASITIDRELYSYERGGRRDPFSSLLQSDDLKPAVSDLKLIGVVLDPRGRNSIAVMRDLSTKELYRVRPGQSVGRLRVTQISQRSVTFLIEEFGVTRQETLSLKDANNARNP